LHFSRYKTTKERIYLVRAKAIIKTAVKQVKEGIVAMLPVLSFMEAEKASLTQEPEIVRQKYDLAIASALAQESFNFVGIICEKGASHFVHTHVDFARELLEDASRCYSRFGSPVLLERVRDKMTLLQLQQIQPPLSVSIKTHKQ
jgi:hypothetical protein